MKLKYPFYLNLPVQYETHFQKDDSCIFTEAEQIIPQRYFLQVNHRNWAVDGILPVVLVDYLHNTFKNKRQKEIGYIVLCTMYSKILQPWCISSFEFNKNGYYWRDFKSAINVLIDTGLIEITRSHSRNKKIAREYMYNIKTLLAIMKHNNVFLKGLYGKIIMPKPRYDFDDLELKLALKNLSLTFSVHNAIEYIQTLHVLEQFQYFDTMRKIPDGTLKPSWRISNGMLYSNNPAVFNIKRELWQTNIMGGGETLYSIDFEACHPNMTSILLTGKPCSPDVYERFIFFLPEQFQEWTRSTTKYQFNRYLNGGRIPYAPTEINEQIKHAIMNAIDAEDHTFDEAKEVQREANKRTGMIITQTVKEACSNGMTNLFPIADGIYAVGQQERIKDLLEKHAKEIMQQEIKAKIKPLPDKKQRDK